MDKLARARELGILKDGWRFIDYALDAAPKFGWLCNVIWGEKGAGKSATMLQHGYAVFHGFDAFEEVGRHEDGTPIRRGLITDWSDMGSWEKALAHVVFRPRDFASLLGTVLKEKRRLTWVGWDDINIHFPRSMYSTNRRTWEQFARNWEGFRANLSIFECTAPRKDKVVSFILSDMTWDCLVSARHKAEMTRWFWDRDFYEPERVLKFRLDITAEDVDLSRIPAEVWTQYWGRKVALIDESTEDFRGMLEEMESATTSADQRATTSKDFLCTVCGRDLGNGYNLKMHMGLHIKRGEAPLKAMSVTPPQDTN